MEKSVTFKFYWNINGGRLNGSFFSLLLLLDNIFSALNKIL